MKIHHLRHATFVIEANDHFILIDPMLGRKASMPPFAFFRHKALKNPIIEMPANSQEILDKVTHCLVTHYHPDHIDKAGIQFLKERQIPVFCSYIDQKKLEKQGLKIEQSIQYWENQEFLGGKVCGIPARHGYGWVAKPAGDVMGYFVDLPDQASLYISADTIYTPDVDKVFEVFKPDLSVVASGAAQFDIGRPLIMDPTDVIKFIRNAPGKVYANHMEAVNHCPYNREKLNTDLHTNHLSDKVFVPEDGESFEF
ncbi:MBL fold metallo-hydrolase [Marinifilum caeruleilacunae]|uniref:MBL fold metallo-hydrolase n=1 Tax=Marinifilum caeruleilacunae TaxID=2499076 RepID=A0ABX1WR34_9BACT|nr:MBL fold metallo-hydrolase [Marinifilum caeruleilacunae]NOU58532.1 MBL fold metallo-hydrolase [Marinifilum caeruleilacunae]